MKIKIIALFLLLITSISAYAQTPQPLEKLFLMADDDEGTFLGSFANKFSSASIFNEFGNYGSRFSSTSIFNQFGKYGSELSDYSPFNKLANHPPFIVDRDGNIYGRLSINIRIRGVTDDSHEIAMRLKARWNILNK